MWRIRLHRVTRVFFVLRPIATLCLFTAAMTAVPTIAGWVNGFWPRIGAVILIAALSVVGVVMAQRPTQVLRSRGPALLPDEQPELLGDGKLLRQLIDEEERMRTAENPRPGPRVILLHGKPGVGKSLLAYHLAKQLAKYYPDGQLYARLGKTNDRTPIAVLGHFLAEMGVPQEEINSTQDKRYSFLTNTRGKRILVLLDGVRNIQQLNEVMPAEPNALVIATSRAYLPYLGDSRSHRMAEPDIETAERILRAYAGQKARGQPDRIAQIVEQCGRLPYALRAAGERALSESNGLDGVATRMVERSTRLKYLSPEGRNTTDRIASEYANLTPAVQEAFRRLALVQAASFVPWVLQPLLDVEYSKVGPVLARLREAQLVEPAGKDPIGAMRYQLHPLFRLFAERMLAEGGALDAIEKAQERLRHAYAAAAGEVIKVLVPGFQPTVACPPEHRPEGREWPFHVARLAASWNRIEYANLIGAIQAAHAAGDWGTCWRIAASLVDAPAPADDYLMKPNVFRESVTNAFVLAREAAKLDSPTHGVIAVELAEAVHRLAVDKHSAAHQLIDQHAGNGIVDQRNKAMALRIKAQSMQMLSRHHDATAILTAALAAADAADDEGERGRVRFLQVINDCVLRPASWKEISSFEQAVAANQGTLKVSAYLWLSQAAARNGNDKGKDENIRLAYEEAGLCAANRAEVLLAQAEQGLVDLVSGGLADPEQVVRLAAHAVWAYQVLHCPLGVIRARVVLARVLLMTSRDVEAGEQVREAKQAYQLLGGTQFPALRAYLDLATGELGLYQKANSAPEVLRQAMEFFEDAGNYWHAARSRLVLGIALCAGEKYPAAFAELWQAIAELQRCGDTTGTETACTQLEIVHRDAGIPFTERHRRKLRALARPR